MFFWAWVQRKYWYFTYKINNSWLIANLKKTADDMLPIGILCVYECVCVCIYMHMRIFPVLSVSMGVSSSFFVCLYFGLKKYYKRYDTDVLGFLLCHCLIFLHSKYSGHLWWIYTYASWTASSGSSIKHNISNWEFHYPKYLP